MVARRTLYSISAALVVVIIVAVSLMISGAIVSGSSSSYSLSSSCESLSVTPKNYPFVETSFDYVCGRAAVSDGLLSIAVDGYRFVDGTGIDWQCPSNSHNGSSSSSFSSSSPSSPSCSNSGLYLLVNATIQNVGSGNTSIGPTFQVWLSDSSGRALQNGELGANASFLGQHPNATLPSEDGGVYLPPGAKVDYWLVFNLPGVDPANVPRLSLQYLVLRETSYGGDWVGGGAFSCGPCQKPDVQLIVTGITEAQ